MAFLGPGPQAQRPQPWSSEFDPRLGLPSLSKLWAASGCRSKLLMKRPVAAECGRLSPEWRHGRSCCRAAKGLEQHEFLSCGRRGQAAERVDSVPAFLTTRCESGYRSPGILACSALILLPWVIKVWRGLATCPRSPSWLQSPVPGSELMSHQGST